MPHHRACVTRSAFCPPIDETPPCARAHAHWRCPKLLIGGFRRCSTDQPRLAVMQLSCYFGSRWIIGEVEREQAAFRRYPSIYCSCSSVSSQPSSRRSGVVCPSTRPWKHLDSPHRVATVAREPKPQRATKARNHSIDCIGQTATVTLMSRGEFEWWKSRWKHSRD